METYNIEIQSISNGILVKTDAPGSEAYFAPVYFETFEKAIAFIRKESKEGKFNII